MNSSCFIPSSIIFFSLLLLSISLPRHVYSDEEKFKNCAPNFCGDKVVDYPFWGNQRPDYCGLEGFQVDCNGDVLTLEIKSLNYDITKIGFDPPFLIMRRTDLLSSICPEPNGFLNGFLNTSLDRTPFNTTLEDETAILYYKCNTIEYLDPYHFTCPIQNIVHQGYFLFPGIPGEDELKCDITVEIPVLKSAIAAFIGKKIGIQEVVNSGFEVNWVNELEQCIKCNEFGGRCGHNKSLNNFSCFCPHNLTSCSTDFSQPPGSSQMQTPPTSKSGGTNWRWKTILGSIFGGVAILFALTTFCYIWRRNNSHIFLLSFLHSGKLNNQNIEAFMENQGSLVPTRYTYADVRKITNLFKERLGQGGFGTVYKGKLLDGRLVAVKMLNETKGNGEEFINEVASISRTSHVNVVSLLGFCLEKRKKGLIYEFMPNGSLDKFIGSETHHNTNQHLEWEKLYQIALGVARGLEYLHRGCNTRIVHFDIKPHNILLDKDFLPKISDFGLAKLCTREKSILSMLEARGTIGYIAPEVFNRNFGGVSHKSDVYSYGMVLLEIVGEKRKDHNVASDVSEKYFPYWIYDHIKLNRFGDLGLSTVDDVEIVRKMAVVGLWCIQTNPSDRPSMSNVIEMFERNIETVVVPPKSSVFPCDHSTTLSSPIDDCSS